MKKVIKKTALQTLLALLIVFIFFGCSPKVYNVPYIKPRTTTKYWQLPTGSKIAYNYLPAKGDSVKPYPVIYLHGGPGGYVYSKNIELLSNLADDGYNVYLYDQIGCGLSNRLENIKEYTADRHKQDLEAIVKELKAVKVILIGQSWGGALATLYTADNAEKVDRIIFTNPGEIMPQIIKEPKNNFPDSLQLKAPSDLSAKSNKKALTARGISVAIWANLFGKKLASDYEADGYLTDLATVFTKALVCDSTKALKEEGGAGYYCNIRTNRSFGKLTDPRSKLQNNTIPILLLKGQCDNIEWEYNEEYLNIYKNNQLIVIPNAGHQIFVEQPERYIEEIRKFLNQ
jgi:pimeloyl-ACP methyl ester carboxylesterase